MSKEDMVKEAVEEAKAKAAKEQAEAEETVETEDAQGVEAEAKEATEEATETEGDSEAASEGKKKFFGKKEKKDKKDEKIEELTDRVTRQMAEFDNFRKRSEKEKSQMYEIGAKDIIEKILRAWTWFRTGGGEECSVRRRNGEDLQTAYDYTGIRWSKTNRGSWSGIQSGFPQRSDACGR